MGTDDYFMRLALAQAKTAQESGEVPVGAVVVHQGKVIAAAGNSNLQDMDPTAHAEIQALRKAASIFGNHRLKECDLYVTLEPCSMCAGAMLHARLRRVVYGAADPKAGAAGSVVDLFSARELNHQTTVHPGVMKEECSHVLQNFFKLRRVENKEKAVPLREDALRTPDSAFENLKGFPWSPNFRSDLPSLHGLQLHYLDEGPRDAPISWLCIHGSHSWGYMFRKLVPTWLSAGHRVVLPDLIGFGRSDKPKRTDSHFAEHQVEILKELSENLHLQNIVIVAQGTACSLAQLLAIRLGERVNGIALLNPVDVMQLKQALEFTGEIPGASIFSGSFDKVLRHLSRDALQADEFLAYKAPFSNSGYASALQNPNIWAADNQVKKTSQLSPDMGRKIFVALGLDDPLLENSRSFLSRLSTNAWATLELEKSGHFLPEEGAPLAEALISHFLTGS